MYIVGSDAAIKERAVSLLERLAAGQRRLVTDAEVFQEILHRYVAINRREAIQPAFAVLNEFAEEIFPIESSAVFRAAELVTIYPTLSARDALHVAVMAAHGVTEIATFDRGFDAVPGLTRLPQD